MLLRQCEDILEVVVYAQDDCGESVIMAVCGVYEYLVAKKGCF